MSGKLMCYPCPGARATKVWFGRVRFAQELERWA